MIVALPPTRHTPEDLLALPDNNNLELVDGQFVEKPMSVLSGIVETKMGRRLEVHCDRNQLGVVGSSSTGIRCFADDPTRVRRPNVLFVSRERFTSEHLQEGFLSIAPDLAVEIVSKNDNGWTMVGTMNEKIEEYLAAGVRLIWIVDPMTRVADIHRANGSVARLRENDQLSGEDVVPGFTCRLGDLFPVKVPRSDTPRE